MGGRGRGSDAGDTGFGLRTRQHGARLQDHIAAFASQAIGTLARDGHGRVFGWNLFDGTAKLGKIMNAAPRWPPGSRIEPGP